VAGDDRAVDEIDQACRRGRPVERKAVAEVGRRAVLEQVAGEDDLRVRHRDDDVVVGVAPAQVPQLDHPAARIERQRVVAGERAVGRIDDDLTQVVGQVWLAGDQPPALPLAGLADHRCAADVPPDRCRAEDRVPEHVVGVAMRVDHDADRSRRQLAEVVADLSCVARGRPRVDEQHALVAEHDSEVLVEERVAPNEDAVADLLPTSHRRIVAAP
jgi:hypothetical protein